MDIIKKGSLIKLEFKKTPEEEEEEYDNRFLTIAQRLKRDIIVDEIQDGELLVTKTYTPTGEIKLSNNKKIDNEYENLKQNIAKISTDKKKIEYLSLAYNSLQDKNALNELKILIKGIELTQN